jgi:hypothetical protein
MERPDDISLHMENLTCRTTSPVIVQESPKIFDFSRKYLVFSWKYGLALTSFSLTHSHKVNAIHVMVALRIEKAKNGQICQTLITNRRSL